MLPALPDSTRQAVVPQTCWLATGGWTRGPGAGSRKPPGDAGGSGGDGRDEDPPRAGQPDARTRLLDGMARVVAAKGYAATTITEIVREARVSRRTFYELFFDKAALLVSLFEGTSDKALRILRAAIDPAQPWQGQLEPAYRAYFQALAADPALLQVLYVEILGLGREGLAARRRVNEEIARILLQVFNGGEDRDAPVPRHMATALVGAINELVTDAIEHGRVRQLAELARPTARLTRLVTDAFGRG